MNAHGSAVLEATFAAMAVTAVAAATLTAGYAAFGRAWIEYHSEQALYCLSEGRSPRTCREVFVRSVATSLPFGRLDDVALANERDHWRIEFVWRLSDFDFRVRKSLTPRRILGRRAS